MAKRMTIAHLHALVIEQQARIELLATRIEELEAAATAREQTEAEADCEQRATNHDSFEANGERVFTNFRLAASVCRTQHDRSKKVVPVANGWVVR